MAKSSQRHFLVKVTGIDGYFETKAGGNIAADATRVFDGGSEVPDILAGPPQAGDVTIGRTYDPIRDGELANRLRRVIGRMSATLSVTPTTRDLIATTFPTVYANALLVGLNEPDSNSQSGDPARFELVFAIGSFS